MIRNYFIYGLQRSGTNYLEKIILDNYDFKPINMNNEMLWKHSVIPPTYNFENNPIIIIHKNPYTWIESICLRNEVDWKKRQTNYPIDKESDEQAKLGKKQFSVKALANAYNDFFTNWYKFKEDHNKNVFICKYESILDNDGVLNFLKGLKNKFNWTTDSVKIPGKVPQSPKYTKLHALYYKDEKPTEMTEYQIKLINEIISDKIFTLNQYTKL